VEPIAPAAALLLAVFALTGEFLEMPRELPQLVPGLLPVQALRPGWLAALSFVMTVFIAPWIHRYKIETARHLLVPLAVVSGAIAIARWPAFFPGTPLCIVIQVLAVVGLSWILAKLLLLQRFSGMYYCRRVFSDGELGKLLPFQRSSLEQLQMAICSAPVEQGARVVQLEGNWGQGKSFLLERLEAFLLDRAKDDPCAVVCVNVWEQQSEPDLHLAIVEQVLSHEKYWFPYWWLHYPLSLFVIRTVKEWKLGFSAGKEAAKAEVQIPLTLPKPTGRRYLEQHVNRVRRKGVRTVIVLDEIDRATPRVAQSAMTFARRSLDLPGAVVILSYVDHIIRYKAFNPLVKTLSDLATTMQAVIFDRGPDKAKRGSGPTPGGPFTASDPASLREWEAWQKAAEATLGTPSGTSGTGMRTGTPDALESEDSRLAAALQLAFANADVADRRRLQKKFSERYIGTDRIRMRQLRLDDVAEMVLGFDTVRERVLKMLDYGSGTTLPEPVRDSLVSAINRALKKKFSSPHEPPTLRILEGALLACFSAARELRGTAGSCSPDDIAAVVLVAYYEAHRAML
jgi:hypothetical protein